MPAAQQHRAKDQTLTHAMYDVKSFDNLKLTASFVLTIQGQLKGKLGESPARLLAPLLGGVVKPRH